MSDKAAMIEDLIGTRRNIAVRIKHWGICRSRNVYIYGYFWRQNHEDMCAYTPIKHGTYIVNIIE